MKQTSQQMELRAVAEVQKILHLHRAQGAARLRVLTTLAAEGLSKPLGRAMRRELRPDVVLLAVTKKRLRRFLKTQKSRAGKYGNRNKRKGLSMDTKAR